MAFRKTTQSKKLVSNLYQNGKYWQYRNPSTGKKVSLGAISQREAILAANQLNNEFAVHQAVDVDAITQRVKRVEKTVNSLLDVWFKNYWQPRIDRGEVSKSTLQNHDLPCFNYTRSAIGDQCIHEVHMSDLTNLLTGTSMSKYRRLRSFWQRMFKYAVGMGLCEDNPANAIMTYKEFGGDTRKKRSRLRWEWFMLIYDKARTTPKWGWFADALIVQLYTAVDRSTLMSMHEDQIRNGIWYYTRKKTRQHPHSHVAVTLPSEVKGIIAKRKLCGDTVHGYIFNKSDERYTKAFATMVKASGVDGLVPSDKTPPTTHEVRALAGIVNMAHGKSEQEVQRLMAHKDAKMTQHYLSDHQGIKYLGAEPIDIPFSDLSVLEELCT
jgi:enterobacteria phage integrase